MLATCCSLATEAHTSTQAACRGCSSQRQCKCTLRRSHCLCSQPCQRPCWCHTHAGLWPHQDAQILDACDITQLKDLRLPNAAAAATGIGCCNKTCCAGSCVQVSARKLLRMSGRRLKWRQRRALACTLRPAAPQQAAGPCMHAGVPHGLRAVLLALKGISRSTPEQCFAQHTLSTHLGLARHAMVTIAGLPGQTPAATRHEHTSQAMLLGTQLYISNPNPPNSTVQCWCRHAQVPCTCPGHRPRPLRSHRVPLQLSCAPASCLLHTGPP